MIPELLAATILVHSWYPPGCCGDMHCRPVNCGGIITHSDGSADWVGVHFEAIQVKNSKDGGCHVCILQDNAAGARRQGICIFLAPLG